MGQINIGKEEQCRLLIDDDEYNLVQFHFHSPSEHCVDSTQFAMEMHLVHFNAKGHIAVLGFLYNATSQSEAVKDGGNAFLRYFWDQLPSKETDHEIPLKRSLRFGSLFGGSGDREWITYNGSLTTPPYSEGVRWFVSKSLCSMTEKERKQLAACWGNRHNARECHDYFGRELVIRKDICCSVPSV